MLLAHGAIAQQQVPLRLLRPLDRSAVTEAKLRFLADKAGFGLGADEQAMLKIGLSQGIEAAVAEFMRHKPELCNKRGSTPLFGLPDTMCFQDFVDQKLGEINGTGNANDRRRALEQLTDFRFANSTNAYEQRMFTHLLGLFTTTLRPDTLNGKAAEMASYTEMLRQAAVGDTDLVALAKGVAKHPMMLNFLSGNGSKGPMPNENFGREFMGLMAIGVEDLAGNLNYTDADVVESSKAYSGFVVNGREATFVPANFVEGPKVLFRGTDHQCTAVTAEDAVDCSFQHPNASIHCAEELLHSFVSADPSDELVRELAAVCQANKFKVRPVMQVLLSSQAFYDAANAETVPKLCYETFTGMVRTMNFPITPQAFRDAVSSCNDGDILSAPGALFFPIDGPTSPLTKIDVTDFMVAKLNGVNGSYDKDPKISMDKVEKALFTDKGIQLNAPGVQVFNSCMTDLGVADTLSSAQKQRYMTLFNPTAYDAGTREQKLNAMVGCYRRLLQSTEYNTH